MQVVNRMDYEFVFVNDEGDPHSGILATVDKIGWVSIGCIGNTYLLLDAAEWKSFIKFVNEIDDYINEHGLPGDEFRTISDPQCSS